MRIVDHATIARYSADGIWGDATLPDLFERAVERHPDKPALLDPPNKFDITSGLPLRLTWRELDRCVDRLARIFQTLGLRRDDIVAMQLGSTCEQAVTLLAALKCGLIVSPLPLLWHEHELATALPRIKARAIVTATTITGREHARALGQIAAAMPQAPAILAFGANPPETVVPLDTVFSQKPDTQQEFTWADRAESSANDVATLCWTGDEGLEPQPTLRSHNQWIAAGKMAVLEAELDADSVILCAYPLSGLVPIGLFFAPWLICGCTLAFHHPFDVPSFASQLADDGVTFTGLPPAVIGMFDDAGTLAETGSLTRLTSIACLWPGAVIPQDASAQTPDIVVPIMDIANLGDFAYVARRRAPETAPGRLPQGHITYPTWQDGGPVLLSTRVKGRVTANGQRASLLSGDLTVSSPMIYDRLEGTDETGEPARDAHGFANTRLQCRLVGNRAPEIEITTRNEGLILHGGIAVSIAELDKLYAGHDAIAEAAAFAFDDPVMGERIMAAIVPEPGQTVTLDDVRSYLQSLQVAPFKLPEQLVTVQRIPRGEDGAILRDRVLDHV